MAKRKIAKTRGINLKSVERIWLSASQKGTILGKAITGETPTRSEDSKEAKAPTGSESAEQPTHASG